MAGARFWSLKAGAGASTMAAGVSGPAGDDHPELRRDLVEVLGVVSPMTCMAAPQQGQVVSCGATASSTRVRCGQGCPCKPALLPAALRLGARCSARASPCATACSIASRASCSWSTTSRPRASTQPPQLLQQRAQLPVLLAHRSHSVMTASGSAAGHGAQRSTSSGRNQSARSGRPIKHGHGPLASPSWPSRTPRVRAGASGNRTLAERTPRVFHESPRRFAARSAGIRRDGYRSVSAKGAAPRLKAFESPALLRSEPWWARQGLNL